MPLPHGGWCAENLPALNEDLCSVSIPNSDRHSANSLLILLWAVPVVAYCGLVGAAVFSVFLNRQSVARRGMKGWRGVQVGESNQIFGSVTAQEIVDAIEMQTGRKLDKKARFAQSRSLGFQLQPVSQFFISRAPRPAPILAPVL